MKTRFCTWIAVIFLALAAAAGCADDQAATVSMNLKETDVRAAIESLFRGSGKNFAIEPDVSGVIPDASFQDVSFLVALRTLVKTAGCVYRVDNDVYLIAKKPTATSTEPTASQALADATPVDATSTSETIIEKINLSFLSPSEMLSIMKGQGNSKTTGTSGGMSGMSGMNGMSGMSGLSGLSGLSSSYGSSYGGTSSSSYNRSW
jgi:type II secretory pathway component GspD/PulD (secretin)